MTPARWHQIKEVFNAALETPQPERSGFLESACGGDAGLRAEVERLLAGSEEASWQSPAAEFFTAAAALEPGDTVAHYRIEAKLGEGGMGIVYKARDKRLGRAVALKLIKAQFSRYWEREARAVAALNHPHIATLYEAGEHEGTPYLVMELVDGRRLEGPLPVKQAIEYGIQIADALAAAHTAGIVHRDLKPGNIMITEKSSVKVLDFGLAKLAQPEAAVVSTQTMGLAGTPGYMAPEQMEGQAADTRSDIFAFGCILYELLSGRRAFPGETVIAALTAAATTEPKPLDGVPERLDEVVRRCLRKKPARRFQHMDDVKAELEELRPRVEGGEAREVARSGGRRLPGHRAPVAAGVVMVIAVLTILWRAWQAASPRSEPARAEFLQLTSQPGVEWFPSISPDGKWVVYAGAGPGGHQIYLQSVSGETPLDLSHDASVDDDQPAFSPDGERIAFRSSRAGGGIFVMGRTGEAAKRITHAGFKPSWSPDGAQLAFTTENVELNPR